MAKPNYRQQKRQKELSRKSRQAERLQRRTGKLEGDESPVELPTDANPTPPTLPGITPKVTP